MVRISQAGKINVAKRLIKKKPGALRGNASKAERTLYKQLIAMKRKKRRSFFFQAEDGIRDKGM